MTMSAKDIPLTELLQLPWSRHVATDEDGVFLASVPELEGCFAEGDSAGEALTNLEQVLKEWLEIALADEVPTPSPRRLRDTDYSGRFSVRVPRSLHRELSEWASEEEISLNQLISTVLARAVAQRPFRDEPTDEPVHDAYEQIAAFAVMRGTESIGALKGIGAYLRQGGAINLACVIFAFAAERIAAAEEAASRELGITAALARRENRSLLAEALWRLSLYYDPQNLRTLSGLGQLLHHSGRYEEAVQYLEPVARVDNHALLFLGWSQLIQGRKLEDDSLGSC
jgi:antitoxin HicB